jgi:hypothetical protein
MMFVVTLLAGLTLRLTDVSTVLFGICRPAGRHHARGRTGGADQQPAPPHAGGADPGGRAAQQVE